MSESDVMQVVREAVWVTFLVAGPFMLIALVMGLLVSLVQAMTQLQEATLTFIPKIVLVLGAIIVLGPFVINNMIAFTQQLMDRAISGGIQ